LFMRRVNRKKGLDMLIEALAKVAAGDKRLHLVIAGPDQEGLRPGLSAIIEAREMTPRVTWVGMLSGNLRWGAYRAAEVFILPSHSENFGLVVAEALACERPVLISDKGNIWREVDPAGAGFWAPDTECGTVMLLQRWLDVSEDEQRIMRSRARECFL